MSTPTFRTGDRVVVESPIYRGGGVTFEHDSPRVHPGSRGVITGHGPDSDGDYRVDFPAYPYAPVAADGLLKVADLGSIAEERRATFATAEIRVDVRLFLGDVEITDLLATEGLLAAILKGQTA